jgi:hypothetical protein
MRTRQPVYSEVDRHITEWMARHGITLLRVSLGVVFFWFGVLKFFPGLSPAQSLAARTIDILTFGMVPSSVSVPVLALWECAIGIGLITNLFMLLRISKRHPVHIRPSHQHHGHYGDDHSGAQEQSDLSLPLKDGFGGAR